MEKRELGNGGITEGPVLLLLLLLGRPGLSKFGVQFRGLDLNDVVRVEVEHRVSLGWRLGGDGRAPPSHGAESRSELTD